jgi:hypothetical protein
MNRSVGATTIQTPNLAAAAPETSGRSLSYETATAASAISS